MSTRFNSQAKTIRREAVLKRLRSIPLEVYTLWQNNDESLVTLKPA